MNNYLNYPINYNYQANILPNMHSNQNLMQNNNLYNPYEGFIRGNMFPELYESYNKINPFQIQPMNEQAEILTNLDALGFAITDLNLYLDVFPDDNNALQLFNKYRMQKEELLKQYETKYGPILLNSDALNKYPWQWNNRPWPWEN